MSEMLGVYKAINAVQAELAAVGGISKDRKNIQQNYSFRGIDDVYNTLAPILAKHKLLIFYNDIIFNFIKINIIIISVDLIKIIVIIIIAIFIIIFRFISVFVDCIINFFFIIISRRKIIE